MIPPTLIAAAALAAAGFGAGWAANGWRLGQHLAEQASAHATEKAAALAVALDKRARSTAARGRDLSHALGLAASAANRAGAP